MPSNPTVGDKGDAEESEGRRRQPGSASDETASVSSSQEGVVDDGAGSSGGHRERYECIVCGITTTSAAHLEAHVRGRKHKRRVEVAGARQQRPSTHYCKICDITTTSAQHMAMHVAGKVCGPRATRLWAALVKASSPAYCSLSHSAQSAVGDISRCGE
jgi:transcription elongation factor Elf1